MGSPAKTPSLRSPTKSPPLLSPSINAHQWADAKVGGLTVAEFADDLHYDGELPSSPRSIEACLRLGIDPSDLKFVPYGDFLRRYGSPDLAKIAFEHHQASRQTRFSQLVDYWTKLRKNDPQGTISKRGSIRNNSGRYEDTSERDQKQIEILRRRLEREVGQLQASEEARRQMAAANDAKEKKLQERKEAREAAIRAAREAARRKAQEIEKAKRLEEEIAIKQAKAAAEEERMREEAAAAAEELAAQQRAASKRAREALWRAKGLYAKKEAERAEAERLQRAEAERLELAERERAVREAKIQRQKALAAASAAERALAEQRLSAARAEAALAEERKRQEYAARVALTDANLAERRRHHEQWREARRAAAAEQERLRQEVVAVARRREEEEVAALEEKLQEGTEKVEKVQCERQKEAARRALLLELQLQEKKAAMEEARRREAYEVAEAAARLEEVERRGAFVRERREKERAQRRVANDWAAVERRRLFDEMAAKIKI